MKFDFNFKESNQGFDLKFGEVHNISDGGYDRGYAEGYEQGNTEGYTKGKDDGIAEGYENGYQDGVASLEDVWIGDGKTHLYISIDTEERKDVPLMFSQTVANGVTVDWGDGSAPQTFSGIGTPRPTHTYENIGDYIITLDVSEGCTLGLGMGTGSAGIMGKEQSIYANMLKKAEIGKGVTSIDNGAFRHCYGLSNVVMSEGVTTIDESAFVACYGLKNIVIPESVTSIGNRAFSTCYGLSSVVFPKSVTSIGNNAFASCKLLTSIAIPEGVTSIAESAFNGCSCLSNVVIPEGVTSIGDKAFYTCYSLSSVIFPKSVTSIGTYAFGSCAGMKFLDFTNHTTVPALSSPYEFSGYPSDFEIRVPAALYDEWIAATNWSSNKKYIVAV